MKYTISENWLEYLKTQNTKCVEGKHNFQVADATTYREFINKVCQEARENNWELEVHFTPKGACVVVNDFIVCGWAKERECK